MGKREADRRGCDEGGLLVGPDGGMADHYIPSPWEASFGVMKVPGVADGPWYRRAHSAASPRPQPKVHGGKSIDWGGDTLTKAELAALP